MTRQSTIVVPQLPLLSNFYNQVRFKALPELFLNQSIRSVVMQNLRVPFAKAKASMMYLDR